MSKGLLYGIAAAVAGGVIGVLNKFVGAPAWVVGGLAGLIGALACGMACQKMSNKP